MTKQNLKIKKKDSPINKNDNCNKAFINDTSSINQFHLHKIGPSYMSQEVRLNNAQCPLKRKKLLENHFDMNMPYHPGVDKNLSCPMWPKTYASLLSGLSRPNTNDQLFKWEFYENHFEQNLSLNRY
jgi:hypothetical protein